MVQYWADTINAAAGYLFVCVPAIQWLLWRIDRRWVAIPIALLLFAHGGSWIVYGYSLRAGESVPLERWQVAYLATEGASHVLPGAMIFTSLIAFLIWKVVSFFPGKNLRGKKVRPLPVGRVYVLMAILVYLGNIPLSHYKSLQYAVEADDLELAERRLEFNLAGVGPNDGKINYLGTYGLLRSPLLPVAVANRSKKMVELLLEHGAELNPKDPNDTSAPEKRVVVRNPLAPAIKNDDVDMLGFLIDKGADPTEGVFPAVIEDKPEALRYLLGRGADVEAARSQFVNPTARKALDEMMQKLKSPPE